MANGTQNTKARVVLVDDHPLVREHLAALLPREPDVELESSRGEGKFRSGFVGRAAESALLVVALLAAAASAAGAGSQTYGDITFFVASDLHYGYTDTNFNAAVICRGALDRMNALPGQAYPAAVGGGVDSPRGVLLVGDLTENGTSAQWSAFTNDWGLNGERRIAFPVYEGYGNHDCHGPGVTNAIKARNLQRTGVTNISTNGYHYSWDWDYLHVVCLNIFPANEASAFDPVSDPKGSLQFLADDLAARVGNSGRPIVIYHHYGLDSMSQPWWTDQQRTNYYQVIAPYNVVGIFAGHDHQVDFVPWQGFSTFNDGTLGKTAGNFLVAHLVGTKLVVAERTAASTWGALYTQQVYVSSSPTILANPQSVTVPIGSSATLAVTAIGPGLGYQWFFDGTNAIPGATNSTLVLTDVHQQQSGPYEVMISTPAGSVASPVANVTVVTRLDIQPGPVLTLFASEQTSWRLEYKNSLGATAQWLPMATVTMSNSPLRFFDTSARGQPQRFYRAVMAQ
jgi:hypothetical protein